MTCRLDLVCEIFSSRLRKTDFGNITCAFKQHKLLLPPLPFRKQKMNLQIMLCQHSNSHYGLEVVSKTRSGSGSSGYRCWTFWRDKPVTWGTIQKDGSDWGVYFLFQQSIEKLVCSIIGIMLGETLIWVFVYKTWKRSIYLYELLQFLILSLPFLIPAKEFYNCPEHIISAKSIIVMFILACFRNIHAYVLAVLC